MVRGVCGEDTRVLDGSTAKEAALAVYIGSLSTNLRPQENVSSVGGNLGEGQKRGATPGIP